MTTNLLPGQNISITKNSPTLKKLRINLNTVTSDSSLKENLTMGAILCNEQGKLNDSNDLVHFNNLTNSHHDTTMTDDFSLTININEIPQSIAKIHIILWTNNNKKLFQLDKIKCNIDDADNDRQIAYYNDYVNNLNKENAIIVVEIYRRNGDWKIKNRGDGWSNGVQGIIQSYGVE